MKMWTIDVSYDANGAVVKRIKAVEALRRTRCGWELSEAGAWLPHTKVYETREAALAAVEARTWRLIGELLATVELLKVRTTEVVE